jgi:Leucine-rich repeat (LRR) protein
VGTAMMQSHNNNLEMQSQMSISSIHSSSSNNPNSYYYTKRNLIKTERIHEEFQLIKLTQILMISHCGLTSIPEEEFSQVNEEEIKRIRRFDISHNFISSIPSYLLNVMTNLREIWLNNNPISVFPQELLALPLLETIDIQHTKISEIPLEIVELKQLVDFDWRNTPLSNNLLETFHVEENDLTTLREVFQDLYLRKTARKQLYELLYGEFYIMDADKSYTAVTIAGFIDVSFHLSRLLAIYLIFLTFSSPLVVCLFVVFFHFFILVFFFILGIIKSIR